MSTSGKLQSRAFYDPALRTLLKTTGNVFDGLGNVVQSVGDASIRIQYETASIWNKYAPYLENLQTGFDSAQGFIGDVGRSRDKFVASILSTTGKALTGWSAHSGAMIRAASGIARDPFNINNIGNLATSILNTFSPGTSANPGLGDRMNASLQKLNLDKVAKAPDILFSSIGHLARAVDNLLAIPISYISTIYYGLMNLIRQIGKLITDTINAVFDLLLNFLDQLIPIKDFMQLLSDIGTLAGQIQGIASIFGGANIVSGFALQINTLTTQINSALSNPFDTVLGFLPNDISRNVSQILYNLENPQQLINQFLPPELSEITAKISQVTGYGFNGNMGFGLESILQGARQGLVTGFLNNFITQYDVLAPLLGGRNTKSPIMPGGTPSLVNGYNSGLNNRNYSAPEQWGVTPIRQAQPVGP